ncbi:hypothetical protein E2C01_070597 [Portunus trituberculatus]|uniref:Uncharacterized protein n=1 Tax=Portunus trituberculatus TaxID=210409 RepID=A0A5B7HUK2_PORTR|nr:hypothetical protein [Portunus trituberculatus]
MNEVRVTNSLGLHSLQQKVTLKVRVTRFRVYIPEGITLIRLLILGEKCHTVGSDFNLNGRQNNVFFFIALVSLC